MTRDLERDLRGYVDDCRYDKVGAVSYYVGNPQNIHNGVECLTGLGLRPLNLKKIKSPKVRYWRNLLKGGNMEPKGFYFRAKRAGERDFIVLLGSHTINNGTMYDYVIRFFGWKEVEDKKGYKPYIPDLEDFAKECSKDIKYLTEACKSGTIYEGRFRARSLQHLKTTEHSLKRMGFRQMRLSSIKNGKMRHWRSILRSGSIKPACYKLEVPGYKRGIKCLVGSYVDEDDRELFIVEMFGTRTLLDDEKYWQCR